MHATTSVDLGPRVSCPDLAVNNSLKSDWVYFTAGCVSLNLHHTMQNDLKIANAWVAALSLASNLDTLKMSLQ